MEKYCGACLMENGENRALATHNAKKKGNCEMSCFVLKQLDAKRTEDKTLLDLFQLCREQVVRVTSTQHFPNHIAVTTQKGFIEFVDICNGEFRLFLTHLEQHIPLESSVRCISLVPSHFFTLYASGLAHSDSYVPHLLYSLAFSNELLLANLESGAVSVLAAFNTRPSALFCDADYIVCGEGSGQVSVWSLTQTVRRQGSAAVFPKLLWEKSLLEDTVVCLKVHHERLICFSADYHCCVLLVSTGECLMTWMSEPDPVVDVLFFGNALTHHSTMAVCLNMSISIRTEAEPVSSNFTSWKGATQQSCTGWKFARRFPLDIAIQCATCSGNYLVAGTTSGMVLLYYNDSLEDGRLRELSRFDVGCSVVRVQLYANETLLVVTSTGDIWKWPLSDLIAEADNGILPEGSGAPPQHEQEEPLKLTDVPAKLGSVVTDRSDYTFSERAETLAGEGGREGTVRSEDGYTSQDAHGEGEQQQPSASSTPVIESLLPRQIEVSRLCEEIGGLMQEASSKMTLLPPDPDLQPTSVVAVTKTQPCVMEPPLKRTVADEESITIVEGPLQELKDSTKLKSNIPSSIASGSGYSVAGEKDVMHQSSPTNVTACSTSRSTSAHHDGGNESDHDTASVAAESEPEVVAVEEENLRDTSTNSISSSLSPRSALPPEPIAEEKSISNKCTAAAVESQPLEGQVAIREKSPTRQKSSASSSRSSHDDSLQDRAVARVDGPNALAQGCPQYYPEGDLVSLQAMMGPPVIVPQLRKGRRMNPLRIQQILKTEELNKEYENVADIEIDDENLQSTAMILERQDALRKLTFDLESYAKEHPLEAEALMYHYSVKLPTYSLKDRVFGDFIPPIIDGGGTEAFKIKNDGHAANTAVENLERLGFPQARSAAEGGGYVDDLMDVTRYRFTRKKDPELIEERRRGGPDISAHPCDDILYPATDSSSTVLFKEYQAQPSDPFALLLPMPLPPIPSVF